MTDRYEHLVHHADTGLGSEEVGMRRFTRPADTITTPAKSLRYFTQPADYLAELDELTDIARALAGSTTGLAYEQVMTLTARLERLADHYEAKHGLHESSSAPVDSATNDTTEADLDPQERNQ